MENIKTAGAVFFFPMICKLAPEMTGYNAFVKINDPIIEAIQEQVYEHKKTYVEGNNRDLIDAYWAQILQTTDRHSSFFEAEGGTKPLYFSCKH
jgi:hypothetical protein